MVKPFRVFAYVAFFLIIIGLPSYFVSDGGFDIGGFKIKYPGVSSLFHLQQQPDTLSSDLPQHVKQFGYLLDSLDLLPLTDTLTSDSDTLVTDSLPTAGADSLGQLPARSLNPPAIGSIPVPLEFPDSSRQSLANFFGALAEGQSRKGIVRVLHFGDSQIEGDRITSYLRQRLQQQFGGSGVGMLHLVPHSYQPAGIIQTASSNWQRVTLADMGKGQPLGNRFGVMGGYSIFTGSKSLFSKGGFNEASVTFVRTASRGKPFSRLRLLYADAAEPFMVSVTSQGKALEAEMVEPGRHPRQLIMGLGTGINAFSIELRGDASPLFYGVSLEGSTGLQVDNIAIRGSSGTDFIRADAAITKSLFAMLNVKLIILQFGVNLVPHVVDSYDYYENQMYRQILALKASSPRASVVLIGVSDVARKEGNTFASYPNIEAIRNAQRNAARRAGAAFWDCYAAMGGKNSMVAWANAKPPLASRDYIHFSPRGARLIAEMFYTALYNEYEEFLREQTGAPESIPQAVTH